jgi:hypothetical protein
MGGIGGYFDWIKQGGTRRFVAGVIVPLVLVLGTTAALVDGGSNPGPSSAVVPEPSATAASPTALAQPAATSTTAPLPQPSPTSPPAAPAATATAVLPAATSTSAPPPPPAATATAAAPIVPLVQQPAATSTSAPVQFVAPTSTSAPPPPPTATAVRAPSGGNCDPSYPTVCIPRYPPDLDCGDIPYRRFQVLPPDPHRFDGSDNDGIGCES